MNKLAMYDVILAPGGDREVDPDVRAQPGRVQGPQGRDQAGDQGRGRRPVRRQGHRGEHAGPEGQEKRFKGRVGFRSDVKKAIVTLAEGQSIDVTTGI